MLEHSHRLHENKEKFFNLEENQVFNSFFKMTVRNVVVLYFVHNETTVWKSSGRVPVLLWPESRHEGRAKVWDLLSRDKDRFSFLRWKSACVSSHFRQTGPAIRVAVLVTSTFSVYNKVGVFVQVYDFLQCSEEANFCPKTELALWTAAFHFLPTLRIKLLW
jgi:hypothetical protein